MNTVTVSQEVKSSSLHELLKQIAQEEFVKQISFAIIEDLKTLSEVYKEIGPTLYQNTFPLGFKPNICEITEGPFRGAYVGYCTLFLDLGFFAEPVAEFVVAHFEATPNQVAPPHKTVGGNIFSSSDGIFFIDYTYTWFIRRRVD